MFVVYNDISMQLDHIVKSYDVRGTYPDQITETAVYALGRALVVHLDAGAIAVGRDCRESSPALYDELIRAITDQGADAYDLGEITTPMLYFATQQLDVDGGAMITASHNPAQYNGIKMTQAGGTPIGLESGLAEIRDIAAAGSFSEPKTTGVPKKHDIRDQWYESNSSIASFGEKTFSIVVDTANMMGALDLAIYRQLEPALTVQTLYEDLDGSMPNHEANPLKKQTLTDLADAVKMNKADIGIAYDGDADRVGFVDETGEPVQPHLITALLSRSILDEHPDATIAYDVPSSRSVKEEIEKHGGTPLMTKVGTANIKTAMREHEAQFGGEFSGHYYFREHEYCEAPTRVALLVLNMMAKENKTLSELIASVKHYEHSGEINFELEPDTDKQAILEQFKDNYSDGELTDMDGIRIDYDDWWFLVRPSNTEPLMRMMIEATDQKTLEAKKKELSTYIES